MVTATILAILFYWFSRKFKRPVKVPTPVTAAFQHLYPTVEEVTWYAHSKNQYEAYFATSDAARKSVYFDQTGNVVF